MIKYCTSHIILNRALITQVSLIDICLKELKLISVRVIEVCDFDASFKDEWICLEFDVIFKFFVPTVNILYLETKVSDTNVVHVDRIINSIIWRSIILYQFNLEGSSVNKG
ncbi:hypothetical protein EL22_24910 [Halostagnicola sp. A56]|nr:hypothetical protein EL22_24910 [Halostagnicola sp. A56]